VVGSDCSVRRETTLKQLQTIVSERRVLGPALWEIWCAAPGLSDFQPGQFFLDPAILAQLTNIA
jgi:hypothetical protein